MTRPKGLPAAVIADVIARRRTTYRYLGLGRLTILWDTRTPWPDRKAGER